MSMSNCAVTFSLEDEVRERGGRGDSREGKELRTIDVLTHLVTEHSALTSVPSASSVLSAFSNADFRFRYHPMRDVEVTGKWGGNGNG